MSAIACHSCGKPVTGKGNLSLFRSPDGVGYIFHSECFLPFFGKMDDETLAELSWMTDAKAEIDRRQKRYCGHRKPTPFFYYDTLGKVDEYKGEWPEGATRAEIASYISDCVADHGGPREKRINFDIWRRYLKKRRATIRITEGGGVNRRRFFATLFGSFVAVLWPRKAKALTNRTDGIENPFAWGISDIQKKAMDQMRLRHLTAIRERIAESGLNQLTNGTEPLKSWGCADGAIFANGKEVGRDWQWQIQQGIPRAIMQSKADSSEIVRHLLAHYGKGTV
jgi:hypothetical protein